jgi:hypothetical protein
MNSGCGANQTRHCGALPTKEAARSVRIAVRDAAVATQMYGNIHDGSAGEHAFIKRACTAEGTNGRCALIASSIVRKHVHVTSTSCTGATTTVRMQLCARARVVARGFRALNDIRGTGTPCTGGSPRWTPRMWPPCTWRTPHSHSLRSHVALDRLCPLPFGAPFYCTSCHRWSRSLPYRARRERRSCGANGQQ